MKDQKTSRTKGRDGVRIVADEDVPKAGIMRYVRDKRGRRVGILVGVEIHDLSLSSLCPHVGIGWSLCRKGDSFDWEDGMRRAMRHCGQPMPPSMLPQAVAFRTQCFLKWPSTHRIADVAAMVVPRIRKLNSCPLPVRNSGHRPGCPRAEEGGSRRNCQCWKIARASVPVVRKNYLSRK